MALEVSTQSSEQGVVVALAGELDIAEAPRVESVLRRVEETHPHLVVLDLRQLDFLDSSGLRIVLAADRRARDDGRRLAIVKGPEAVQRVFKVTRVDQRLEFMDLPEELGV